MTTDLKPWPDDVLKQPVSFLVNHEKDYGLPVGHLTFGERVVASVHDAAVITYIQALKGEAEAARADSDQLRRLAYAYPPSDPFAADGQTWKQVADSMERERDQLRQEVQRLQALASEVHRLGLVIESAVRYSDPGNRPQIIAMLAEASALSPRSVQGGEV